MCRAALPRGWQQAQGCGCASVFHCCKMQFLGALENPRCAHRSLPGQVNRLPGSQTHSPSPHALLPTFSRSLRPRLPLPVIPLAHISSSCSHLIHHLTSPSQNAARQTGAAGAQHVPISSSPTFLDQQGSAGWPLAALMSLPSLMARDAMLQCFFLDVQSSPPQPHMHRERAANVLGACRVKAGGTP